MAINEIDVTTLERNSTDDGTWVTGRWQEIDSDTGAYIDVSVLSGDRMLIAVAGSSDKGTAAIRIGAGNRSDESLGAVYMSLGDSDNRDGSSKDKPVHLIYVNTARCKDSNDRINIYSAGNTAAGNTAASTVEMHVAAYYLANM